MIISRQHSLPKGAWFVVACLFVVGTLNYIDRNMLTTMRSSIMDSIPMNDTQFGLLTSAFLWVYGLMSPIAGYLADKFKRSSVIITSLVAWSIITWLTGEATTYNQLLLYRALMGISEAFYMPAAMAMIIDYHKGPTQSLAVAVNLTGVMTGSSLGFLGGWIAENYTWHTAFNSFGIIGVIYAFVLIFFLKDAPKENGSSESQPPISREPLAKVTLKNAFRQLFGQSPFIYLLIFWSLLGAINWIITAWLPTYYKEQFNLSQGLAGFYATAFLYPISIIGLLLGGFISDAWSKKNEYARISVPIIGLLIAVPSIFLASYIYVLPLAILFFMLYGLSSKFSDTNIMPVLCLIADKKYRATGYGILNMFSTIIGGLGVYATGAFRDIDINLSVIYQIAAIILLLCSGILFLVKKSVKLQGTEI